MNKLLVRNLLKYTLGLPIVILFVIAFIPLLVSCFVLDLVLGVFFFIFSGRNIEFDLVVFFYEFMVSVILPCK